MLVGILSDSHNHVLPVRRALGLFDSLGVEFTIHCGDVGGEDVFAEFIGRPFSFVWGNTDDPSAGLLAYLGAVGIRPPGAVPVLLELDGRRVAVFHGHEQSFPAAGLAARADYLLHGHTHLARDQRDGAIRFVNPGALHRTRRKTVATLDTARDHVTFHDVEG